MFMRRVIMYVRCKTMNVLRRKVKVLTKYLGAIHLIIRMGKYMNWKGFEKKTRKTFGKLLACNLTLQNIIVFSKK